MSRAADALSLASPAVSLHVRELEHELEATLFERRGRGVASTPAGDLLHALARPLLEEFDTLIERFDAFDRASVSESVQIASDGGAATEVFFRVCRRLLGEHPELDLRLRDDSLDEGLRRLRDGEVDLVFGSAGRVPEEFVYHPLLSSRWVLIAPAEHPLAARETVTLEELGAWTTIAPVPEQIHSAPEGGELAYRHPGYRRKVGVETNGWLAAGAFVEAGLGVGVADALAIPETLRVAVVPLAERLPNRGYGLFLRRDGPEPRSFPLVVEAARSEYPDASPAGEAAVAAGGEAGASTAMAADRAARAVGPDRAVGPVTPGKGPSVGFKGDPLGKLRAFGLTVRHRNISEAARRVFSNQPTVSKWIREIETEVGAKLFNRSARGIAPTPAAERLHRASGPLVHALDRLPETFAERFRGEFAGGLRIAAGQLSAASLLPRYLERFRESCPGVEVNVMTGTGEERLEWLRSFEVELAIGALDVAEEGLEFHRLADSKFVIITPEDHPLAGRESVEVAELAVFPSITHPADHSIGRLEDMVLRQRGLAVNRVMEVAGWNAIRRYVEAGVGIAMVPDVSLTEADRVWKVPLSDVSIRRAYGVLARKDSTPSLAAERFLELALADSGVADGG